MDFELDIPGQIFKLKSGDVPKFLDGIKEKLIKSAHSFILRELDNSVALSMMIGQAPDPEALRAITRSVQVTYKNGAEPGITAEFKDIYSHLYGGEELPEEIASQFNKQLDEALDRWYNSGEQDKIIDQVCLEDA